MGLIRADIEATLAALEADAAGMDTTVPKGKTGKIDAIAVSLKASDQVATMARTLNARTVLELCSLQDRIDALERGRSDG